MTVKRILEKLISPSVTFMCDYDTETKKSEIYFVLFSEKNSRSLETVRVESSGSNILPSYLWEFYLDKYEKYSKLKDENPERYLYYRRLKYALTKDNSFVENCYRISETLSSSMPGYSMVGYSLLAPFASSRPCPLPLVVTDIEYLESVSGEVSISADLNVVLNRMETGDFVATFKNKITEEYDYDHRVTLGPENVLELNSLDGGFNLLNYKDNASLLLRDLQTMSFKDDSKLEDFLNCIQKLAEVEMLLLGEDAGFSLCPD